MFLHLSVSHSVHRGRGVCPPPQVGQTPSPDADPLQMQTPQGWADPLDADPPGCTDPLDADPPGWTDPPGCRPPRVGENPPQMQTPSRCRPPPGCRPPWGSADPPPLQIRSTSGRYASYWNAYLLIHKFLRATRSEALHQRLFFQDA